MVTAVHFSPTKLFVTQTFSGFWGDSLEMRGKNFNSRTTS